MIASLTITIFIESIIAIGYALWRKKSLVHVLVAIILANCVTQVLLWAVLSLFYWQYLTVLFVSEICIISIEWIILYLYRHTQLQAREALLLSLVANLASFSIGWLLPV